MNEKIYEYDAVIRSSVVGKGGAYVTFTREIGRIRYEKSVHRLYHSNRVLYGFVLYYMLFRLIGRQMVITSAQMLENYNYWNSVNLMPFKTIAEYITAVIDGGIRGHAIRNLVGNLLLFFPAGFYLPFFMRKTSKLKIYSIVMVALIVSVELVQVLTMTGSLDVDDFILNFMGALIGYFVFTRTAACSLFKLCAWQKSDTGQEKNSGTIEKI